MEMEMFPEVFSNIAGYFDFNRLQKDHSEMIEPFLQPDFYDAYLRDSPQSLSDLPEVLRNQLTQGLKLDETVKSSGQHLVDSSGKKLESGTKPILLPDGTSNRALRPNSQLILPGSGTQSGSSSSLIIPGKSEPKAPIALSETQSAKELILPKTTAWQSLYARWKALDHETKRSVAKWENLSSMKKASLVLRRSTGVTAGMAVQWIKPKADLPPEEKRLFERLEYVMDGNAIEFRHREDVIVHDPNEFLNDVTTLAKRAGIENKILNPQNSRLSSGGLHFHVSVPGRDLRELAKAFNWLALVRKIEGGDLGDLTKLDQYKFDPTATLKGHVRTYPKDPSRVEFRSHFVSLQEELSLIIKAFSAEPSEGMKLVRDAIERSTTDYVIEKLAEYRADLLSEFLPYMTSLSAAQQKKVQGALDLAKRMRRLEAFHEPEDLFQLAPEVLRGKNPVYRNTIIGELGLVKDWPISFWTSYIDLIENTPVQERWNVFSAIESHHRWPKNFWERVPHMLASSAGNTVAISSLSNAISLQPEWPPEFWKEISRYLIEKNPVLTRAFIAQGLKGQKHWPTSVWNKVIEILRDPNANQKRQLLDAIYRKTEIPNEAIEVIRALSKDKDPELSSFAQIVLHYHASYSCQASFSKVK